jgi:hypothetical protein
MTWTYSGAPVAGTVDEVRFLVQDTDASDPLLTDEEIQYVMDEFGTGVSAAAQLARTLQAKFARFVDTTVGSVSESASQRAAQYQALAERLEQQLGYRATPTFGGISQSVKDSLDADTGAAQVAFKRDQFSNPSAGGD